MTIECGVHHAPTAAVLCANCNHPAHRHELANPHACRGLSASGTAPVCLCDEFVAPEGMTVKE